MSDFRKDYIDSRLGGKNGDSDNSNGDICMGCGQPVVFMGGRTGATCTNDQCGSKGLSLFPQQRLMPQKYLEQLKKRDNGSGRDNI
jgi:hypothetical protein